MPDFSHLPPEEAEAARKAWSRQMQREREWFARQRLKAIVAQPDFNGRASTEFYGFGKVLGQGSFGEVRLAWHRLAGAKVAIKSYEKAKLTEPNHWKRVQHEIKLMERLNLPHTIRELEMIDSVKRIHIVMEYAGGGNLCSYVKGKGKLGEAEARRLFVQLLGAVEYMHDLGIIHRDIKVRAAGGGGGGGGGAPRAREGETARPRGGRTSAVRAPPRPLSTVATLPPAALSRVPAPAPPAAGERAV
jgi:serine/threonine protein kinase